MAQYPGQSLLRMWLMGVHFREAFEDWTSIGLAYTKARMMLVESLGIGH